jgi:hypothetical protein
VGDLLGGGALQREGWDVLGDLGGEDVGPGGGDAQEQLPRQQGGRGAERRDERRRHAAQEGQRQRAPGRRLGLQGEPAAVTQPAGQGGHQVGQHQRGADRRQPLEVDPDDLQRRQPQQRAGARLAPVGLQQREEQRHEQQRQYDRPHRQEVPGQEQGRDEGRRE